MTGRHMTLAEMREAEARQREVERQGRKPTRPAPDAARARHWLAGGGYDRAALERDGFDDS